MAATATSLFKPDTPTSIAQETFLVAMDNGTSITITPTYIKSIQNITWVPVNSTAATNLTGTYANGFDFGEATVAFVSANSANFLVTVYGTIA
jgi:hypothetical protein